MSPRMYVFIGKIFMFVGLFFFGSIGWILLRFISVKLGFDPDESVRDQGMIYTKSLR